MSEDLGTVREALHECSENLLRHANVVATGIGCRVTEGRRTAGLSIVCSVNEKIRPSLLSRRERVPQAVDGIPIDVVATGWIRALQSHTDRQRPAPGGVSIGHRDITAGTLGCLVKKDGQVYILSNNHVLANSNAASPGDAILQPGPHDGGKYPEDQIADLTEFVPISFFGLPSQAEDNLVDAAIAQPIEDRDVSEQILGIGPIKGMTQAELGMLIQKSGRTTEFTTGQIQQVDVTVNVQYGEGRIARFADQVMAGPMSQGGDSGSAVLDQNNRLVGLLFEGSDSSTLINRIENVFSALGVSL